MLRNVQIEINPACCRPHSAYQDQKIAAWPIRPASVSLARWKRDRKSASVLLLIFLWATLSEIDPARKDVVVAEVGAAAALVGLVLVFLGVLVTSYQSLLGQLSKERLAPFKRAAWFALGVFSAGLGSLAISVAWLVASGGQCFYVATLILFFGELVALAVVAAYSARVLLR